MLVALNVTTLAGVSPGKEKTARSTYRRRARTRCRCRSGVFFCWVERWKLAVRLEGLTVAPNKCVPQTGPVIKKCVRVISQKLQTYRFPPLNDPSRLAPLPRRMSTADTYKRSAPAPGVSGALYALSYVTHPTTQSTDDTALLIVLSSSLSRICTEVFVQTIDKNKCGLYEYYSTTSTSFFDSHKKKRGQAWRPL